MGEPQIPIDKSLRSVFVGNIPYDVTEEKLKEIFSEAGPVVSFKIVYDRETGKPKGYGFCEYRDQETALSAMRNLSGYEIAGRTLRVDSACTEKSMQGMIPEVKSTAGPSPYGEPVDPTNTPQIISKAVSSLPPEQMFELMQQMKQCIQTNPNDTRQMLMQNPQLSYALLQALIAMRAVDPANAASMLHKGPGFSGFPDSSMGMQQPLPQHYGPNKPFPMQSNEPWAGPLGPSGAGPPRPGFIGNRPFPGQDLDLRHADMVRGDHDLRVMSGPGPGPPVGAVGGFGGMGMMPQNIRPPQPVGDLDPRRDPRSVGPPGPRDPRALGGRPPGPNLPPVMPGSSITSGIPPASLLASAQNVHWGAGASDEERDALISQVLQLSDEQIAKLSPEQQQSLMALKEQAVRRAR